MSSAYSGATQYSAPVSTLDIAQLTGTVQTAMQQKYDANLAKVDSLIEQFTSAPLVRAEDKKYLGERLQAVLTAVDQNSRINWTSGSATRAMNAQLATAIDDRVLKQMSNSQAIISFEQTAAERKAKNPELYNDANYIYAKDKAGYAKYMAGESDDIGSLQYIDYYDVKKNLTDEVEKFAKERGFEKVLNTKQDGYVFISEKGKEVRPEEIEAFVKSAIDSDSRLQQQLLIDSHAKYRGAKDEDVLNSYKKYVESTTSEYDNKLTEIDNKIKNTSSDKKDEILALEKAKLAITEGKKALVASTDPSKFNRDSFQYQQHLGSLTNKYVQTYSLKAVTDYELDDTYLKVQKAMNDTDSDSNSDSEGGFGSGANAGQVYDRVVNELDKDKEINQLSTLRTNSGNAWKKAVSLIRGNLVAQGKSATDKDVTLYYAGLKDAAKKGFDLNAKGYTDEEIQAYYDVTSNNVALDKSRKVAKQYIGAASEETLSGLFGGTKKGLNLEGIAQTMPHTAEIISKYKSLDKVPPKEKALALLEVASNAKNTISSEEDSAYYDLYIENLKHENKISSKDIKAKTSSGTQPGFWSSLGDVAAAHGKDILRASGNVFGMLTDPAGLFSRAEQKKERDIQADKDRAASYKDISNAYSNLGKSFATDRNLSEVQSGDIDLKDFRDPKKIFSRALEDTKRQVEVEAKKQIALIPKTKSIVLNPSLKSDKVVVNQIKSAITASGGVPSSDSYINIIDVKDGLATIEYTAVTDQQTKSGTTKKYNEIQTIQIPSSNLPSSLINRMNYDLTSFSNSVKNTTKTSRPIAFNLPKDYDSKRELEQSLLTNSAGSMTKEEASFLSLKGLPEIKTREELLKQASALPKDYYETFSKDLSADYKVVWDRPEGGGAFIGRLLKDGKEVSKQTSGEDFSPYKYKAYTMLFVQNYINSRLQELTSQYRKSRQ